MTCHNTRRGLRNEGNWATTSAGDRSRAPHPGAQADVLMGENGYFVNVGIRGAHSFVEDTCVKCHLEATAPPDLLSYQQGGTNHTFFASPDICAKCHGESFTADGVHDGFEAAAAELKELLETALRNHMSYLISQGYKLDLNKLGTVTNMADVASVEFGEAHGRQALTIKFTNGQSVGPVEANLIKVLDGTGASKGDLYNNSVKNPDERLMKAGWNWNLVESDGSQGVHNPTFVFGLLDIAIDNLNNLLAGK